MNDYIERYFIVRVFEKVVGYICIGAFSDHDIIARMYMMQEHGNEYGHYIAQGDSSFQLLKRWELTPIEYNEYTKERIEANLVSIHTNRDIKAIAPSWVDRSADRGK